MTVIYSKETREPDFARYREQWEGGVLAATLAACADLGEIERRDLAKAWFHGSFNGAAFGVYGEGDLGAGRLEWQQTGPTHFDGVYTAPYGLTCSLARVYRQPDGSWAALVIAGVRDDHFEALAAAEWAIAKLCA